MLSGEYNLAQARKDYVATNQVSAQQSQKTQYTTNPALTNRMAKLQGVQTQQSTNANTKADVSEEELTDEKLAEKMKPKEENDFKMILYRWLRGFHKRHLKDLE